MSNKLWSGWVINFNGDFVIELLCMDAWSAQNFHTRCDNKGPTVIIVKVGECIFGGYTDQNWQGNKHTFL